MSKLTKQEIEALMRKHRIPKGSDNPFAQALGAPPLHYLEEEDNDSQPPSASTGSD